MASYNLELVYIPLNVRYIELNKITENWIVDVIGYGAYGKVFKAKYDNKVVAIKRFERKFPSDSFKNDKSDLHSQMKIELDVLRSIDCKHIIKLLAYSDDDKPCLVYEYMPNGSLNTRLQRIYQSTAPLTWKQRWIITTGTANGLDYLHNNYKNPIIHRDIKTDNILLDAKLEAKIGDFGFAIEGKRNETFRLEKIRGSLGYMSPEYKDRGTVSAKLDVYSYGIVLYELATGQIAYNPVRKQILLKDFVEDRRKKLDWKKDFSIAGDTNDAIFYYLIDLGKKCSSRRLCLRPNIVQVLELLDVYSKGRIPKRTIFCCGF